MKPGQSRDIKQFCKKKIPKLLIKANTRKHGSSAREICEDKASPNYRMLFRKIFWSQTAENNRKNHREGATKSR